MVSQFELALARHRRELLDRESAVQRRILDAYGPVRKRLISRIDAIAGELAGIPDDGRPVKSSLITRAERAVELLQQVETEMAGLAGEVAPAVSGGQAEAVSLAGNHALATVEAIGNPAITASWNRLNTPALESMIGRMSNGAPLESWLGRFGPETGGRLAEALRTASALGTNPRGVARMLARELDVAETRLLLMARTEILGSYRDASLENYRANADIVQGWRWTCAKQTRTCLACLSLDGTIYPLSEPFQRSHPACRCSSVVVLKGESPPDIQSGIQWFRAQPESVQRDMIPVTAWDEFAAGRLRLDDFVHLDRDPEWGDRYREASVRQARANAYLREQLAA